MSPLLRLISEAGLKYEGGGVGAENSIIT